MREIAEKPQRAAEMLTEFIESQHNERITMDDFIEALGGRAFGVAILVLALANLLIANVPGISTILGFPIVLISLQVVLGRSGFWLPKFIRRQEIKKSTLQSMIARANKILKWLEKFIRPRLTFLIDENAKRWIGAYCLILGIVLILPILFGNFMPSWALAFIALGMIEKDGLFALIGFVVGLAATAYATAFYAVGTHIAYNLFG